MPPTPATNVTASLTANGVLMSWTTSAAASESLITARNTISNQVYTTSIVGSNTSATLTNLPAGETYSIYVQYALPRQRLRDEPTPPPEFSDASASVTITLPDSIPCFAEGTRILTQNGYKAIEMLTADDRIVTSDRRILAFKRMKTTLRTTTKRTAPYLVQPHAFGHNLPASPVRLSPIHKIQIGKGRWISPEVAARTNPLVTQCEIGGTVTYYHIECENYLRDNLVTEGLTVESFGSRKAVGGRKDIYTWNERLNAYTRVGNALSNSASAK